mgnify:FL=1|jgi:hypothetical protein|tara:strand:+ start:245 stop:589 length:345 start_codon:yes stop_codon:yes gene_type:complete
MSQPYAKGRRAYGYCDKTGFRYPLHDLVYEVQNGIRTGSRVGRDVFDPDQPQNLLGKVRIFDPQAIRDPRPDQNLGESRGFFGWNPVGDGGNAPDGNGAMGLTGSIGTVTITVS